MDAFSPNAEYVCQSETRCLIDTLRGGTFAMRKAGKAYLPQEAAEKDDDYLARLNRSTLFNQFGRTLKTAVGKVLSQPFAFRTGNKDGLPKAMVPWIEDVDLEGNHLDQFSKLWLEDATAHGVSFAFVDVPKSNVDVRTMATDFDEKIRPYLVLVKNRQLINWQFQRVGGVYKLILAVVDESGYHPDPFDPFNEVYVNQVRVLTPGAWEVYRQQLVVDSQGKPILTDKGEKQYVANLVDAGTTGLDFIPMIAAYTDRIGRFLAKPIFQNLAELNLQHWQSQSDQSNILKVARVPFIVRTGMPTDDEEYEAVTLGGNTAWDLPVGADAKFVEHTGAAINAGRNDLQDIEDKMSKAGFQMVARQTSGDVTATENTLMSAEAHAALTAIAENFKDALEQALKFMAIVGNVKVANKFVEPEVIINKSFGSVQAAVDMPILTQMKSQGIIDSETVISEGKRRGFLAEDVVAAEEEAPVAPQANTVVIPQNQIVPQTKANTVIQDQSHLTP